MWSLPSIVCGVLVGVGALAAPAAAQPLGSWPLDEGAGQVAADATGRGHDGRLGDLAGPDGHDPMWVGGRFGGALRFLGSQDQYASLTNPAGLRPRHVSVEAWVRRLGSPGRWRYVVSSGAVSCEFASYGLYTGFEGGLAFYVSDSDHFVRSPELGASAIWDGAWHKAVGTYDGQHVRLFLDGAEVGAGTPTTLAIAYGSSTAGAYIGTYRGSCERPFTGDIDEVEIHDGAHSSQQVAVEAARDAGRPLPAQAPPVSGPPTVGVSESARRRCVRIVARPKRVVVGRRTRLALTVRARRSGKPLRGRRVSIKGLGVKRRVRTGRAGRARLRVRVRRHGRLRVRAAGQPRRCALRVRALKRR